MNKISTTDQSFLDALYKVIEDNLVNEQFGVEELAREMAVSRSQLHRRIHALTDQSTSQVIREYRLRKAKELLEKESATVAEVSYQVGFGSPSYFNTCFAELYGYPPGEVKFRNQVKSKRKPLITKKIVLLIASILAVFALTYYLAYRYINSEKSKKPLMPENSIAVLAFEDLSPEGDKGYLASGIAYEILRTLNKIENLKVMDLTSPFQFQGENVDLLEKCRKLGADFIIKGSVITDNEKTRVIPRLINVRENTHIWSEKFEYNMTDLFTILDSIGAAVSSELQLTFSGEKAPINISTAAWDHYLKGNYQMTETWSRESFEMAIKYFQEAIKIEPEFAAAYSSLAAAYNKLTGWHSNLPPSEEYRLKSQEAASKALELDPDQAEAYIILAGIARGYENDWNKANAYYKKGMELKPTASWAYIAYMNFLTWMGDFDKSIALGKELIEMDPLSTASHYEHAFSYYIARRDKEFMDQCMKTLALDSVDYGTKVTLALYYIDKREFEKAAFYAGISDSTKITLDTPSFNLVLFGAYYGYSGNTAKAEECLNMLQGKSWDPFSSTWVYISLGRYDEALRIMEESFNRCIKSPHLIGLKTHPVYDPLRDNPRFIRLLEQMKFDEYKME